MFFPGWSPGEVGIWNVSEDSVTPVWPDTEIEGLREPEARNTGGLSHNSVAWWPGCWAGDVPADTSGGK